MKTFWGWGEQQLPDGTLILSAPSGHTFVTTPGSAVLFPSLCAPTGDLPAPAPRTAETCSQRTTMMPLRTRTRAQHRASRIATERNHNRRARTTRREQREAYSLGPGDAVGDGEPPPF